VNIKRKNVFSRHVCHCQLTLHGNRQQAYRHSAGRPVDMFAVESHLRDSRPSDRLVISVERLAHSCCCCCCCMDPSLSTHSTLHPTNITQLSITSVIDILINQSNLLSIRKAP